MNTRKKKYITNNIKNILNRFKTILYKKTTNKSKTKVVKNKTKVVKNKTKVVKSKTKVVKNKTKVVKSKAKVVKNKTKVVKSKTKVVKNKTKVAKNKTKVVKNKAKVVKNKAKVVKSKTKVVKSKTKKKIAKISPLKSIKISPLKSIKLASIKLETSTKLSKNIAKTLRNYSIKDKKEIIKLYSSASPKLISHKRSYNPSINNKLIIHSLKTQPQMSIKLCDDLLQINMNSNGKELCLPYNDKKVQSLLLHNLRASKHLDVSRFIPPVQFLSNCWFNTMFVTFFFSDKGRKFFRFFRELMITGKKVDSSLIPQQFAKIFFILNLFIEASYNQTSKSNILFDKINSLTNNLNTNYFVYHIYKIINNPSKSINPELLVSNSKKIYNIPDIEDPGNPLTYYETILNYLKYNSLKLLKHSITNSVAIDEVIQSKFLMRSSGVIPDIIILEDFQSGSKFNNTITLTSQEANSNSYKYVLDSIILTNKDHFDPNANSHFVSVLTVNGVEYKFDGSSLSKLSPFKWNQMLNTDKDWSFEEDPKYEPEVYNFTKGYKIMFYYRS